MQMPLTPMVKNLLILNIGIFIIGVFTQINLIEIFGLRYLEASEFKPYQLFTHMFIHADWGHLFFNMLGLFTFGPLLERVWDSKRFLAFYMICGLGAALIYSGVVYIQMNGIHKSQIAVNASPSPESYIKFMREVTGNLDLADPNFLRVFEEYPDNKELKKRAKEEVNYIYEIASNFSNVGASGAIFGLLMAFGMLFPNTELRLFLIPIPIKAIYFVIIFGIMELWAGTHVREGDTVAHFAHLGGMLFAFLIIKYWEKERNRFY